MVIYAVTVLLSACLLFLVQPLIAKIILPWFGGTSAVWSAALVFFQICLLAAYEYAHVLATYARPRVQMIVHVTLLALACAFMPIVPSGEWRAASDTEPALRILWLLTTTVGLPAFLLSATSPLLQAWYLRTKGGEAPYWLFALSNFGSLFALLCFPLLLEPSFGSRSLAYGWSGLFFVFAAACAVVAWRSRGGVTEPHHDEHKAAPPTFVRMGLWVAFAACASALLVAVSAQLTTNVAPIPLLWVVPLALYLLTFILAFGNVHLYRRGRFFPLTALAIAGIAYLYTRSSLNMHIYYVIPAYLACLFVICFACHGEVVHLRPHARYLTRFYSLIALGGALGGAFVGIFAPLLFDTYLELPLLLVVVAELCVLMQWHRHGSDRTLWLVRCVMVAGVVVLAAFLVREETRVRDENVLLARNFYGTLRVRDDYVGEDTARRHLTHGTISHGYQFLSPVYRDVAGSYYAENSGVGRALEALEDRGPVRVGVVGLGVGIMSSYARRGDYFRIYEINPAVVRIANEQFSFLARARHAGADIDVLMGDARLVLEQQERQQFDLLVVDAFSSDAIPTHLLTNEAVALYFEHLKPGGVLALHISNRYLDLIPVCQRAAQHVARPAMLVHSERDSMFHASAWVLITSDTKLYEHPQFVGALVENLSTDVAFPGWTDEYSSLWPLLRTRTEE